MARAVLVYDREIGWFSDLWVETNMISHFRRASTVIATLALASAAFAASSEPSAETPSPDTTDSKALIASLLSSHNRERSEAKLAPLSLDSKLTAAARVQADDMAEHGKMTHEGSDGSSPFDRIKKQDYKYSNAAENVAEGLPTVESVMKAWMESPHHKENILGKFTQVGIAMARDKEGRPYYCVDFGTPWPKIEPGQASIDFLALLNKERKAAGKLRLKLSPKLGKVAVKQAEYFASRESSDAKSSNVFGLTESLKENGYPFLKVVELAGWGQPTADELFKYWNDDPKQRIDLLGDFSEVGLGCATGASGAPFWCLLLASPLKK